MAIIITDQYRLRQKNFLDDRQGLATSKSTLLEWNFSTNPLPEGFEVCLDGVWYVFHEDNPEDPETGKFSLRNLDTDTHLETIDRRLDDVEERTQIASQFSDILTPEFWTTEDGVLHVVPGIIVSVYGDSDESLNGLWYLSGNNYTSPDRWIKLVSRGDLITSSSEKESDDISVYTSSRVDSQFPAKSKDETISGNWEFTGENTISGNQTITGETTLSGKTNLTPSSETNIQPGTTINFGDSGKQLEVDLETGKTTLEVDKIISAESDLGDLDDHIYEKLGRIGIGNILRNTSFLGSYSSETFDSQNIMTEDTQVWGDPADGYWEGNNYQFIDLSQSITGKAAKFTALTPPNGYLQQTPAVDLTPGETYTVSWKQLGEITVEFDGNTWTHTTEEYGVVWERFEFTGSSTDPIKFSGTANSIIYEIKLEWGVVPTSWFPNSMDTDPVAAKFLEYDYLKTALTEKENLGNIPGTFKLQTMLQVSSLENHVKGGLSGVYTEDQDIFLWAGGTYRESQDLLKSIKSNPAWFNNTTSLKGPQNPRAVISYKDLSIFTNINAYGEFRGKFYDGGKQIRASGLTAKIPFLDASDDEHGLPNYGDMNFENGILLDTSLDPGNPSPSLNVISEYDNLVTPENMPHTSISFTNGLLNETGRYILKVYTGDSQGFLCRFQDGTTFYLYLTFIDGYLMGVSSEQPDPNYYWY